MTGKQTELGGQHPLLVAYEEAAAAADRAEQEYANARSRLRVAVDERRKDRCRRRDRAARIVADWYSDCVVADAAERLVDADQVVRQAQETEDAAFEAWHDSGAYETTWGTVEVGR